MPTLTSPGVSVSVIDESFYGTAGSGTVPLIVFATASDKAHASGTAGEVAGGTATATGGNKMTLVTSQRDLIQTFGNPLFYSSASGTALVGDWRNEYGLLAAHSYLGIANRAFVLRADIDLSQLTATATEPKGDPANGTYWLDLTNTKLGVFEYSASSTWVSQSVTVINSSTQVDGSQIPVNSLGSDGDYAFVSYASQPSATANRFYRKDAGTWRHLGSAAWRSASSKDFQWASHTAIPTVQSDTTALAVGDVFIKTTKHNSGTDWITKLYSSTTSAFATITSPSLASTTAAHANYTSSPVAGNLFAHYNWDGAAAAGQVGSIKFKRFDGSATTSVTGSVASVSTSLLTNAQAFSINGSTVTFTDVASQSDLITLAANINSAAITNITATVNSDNKLVITNSEGGLDITLAAGGSGTLIANAGLTAGVTTNWTDLSFEPNTATPVGATPDNRYWYDSRTTTVDLLEVYNNAGNNAWRTFAGSTTVASAAPSGPSHGDVWIDSTDLNNYPKMYRYNSATTAWDITDKADQTSALGVVWDDFRKTSASALQSTAPNPASYPIGILGWNFMASGYNVKQYDLATTAWNNASGTISDGSPCMGRFAQKKVIITAMAAAVSSNEDIRSNAIHFNLIAAPGFEDIIDEMKTLNIDRKETAFIIGDTPMRLKNSGTDITSWITNGANVAENSEAGLVTSGTYIGVWYPGAAMSTNTDGTSVVVPMSHVILRTMAYNDQVAYQWFAPAGFSRGVVQNATSVGYIDKTTGEYNSVIMSQGLRDTAYVNKINPVAYMPNKGLAVYGQKTLHPAASALDRINVARLVNYLRKQFDEMAQPFLFEPNDASTRDNVIAVYNGFLGDLVSKRALYDFLVVCDDSNNTATRVDRNELWIDVAIQPVKAVEFIYIPVRIKNTGESLTT